MQNRTFQFLGTAAVLCTFSLNGYSQVETLPSSQSYSGSLLVPNAQVLQTGDFQAKYGQGVPHNEARDDYDSISFAVGLFDGMETFGTIVTKTYDTNLYQDSDGGTRDLSASFKYQLPWIYDLTNINLAVGVQDFGGAANNFNVNYVVADYEPDLLPIRLSAGYGSSDLYNGILNGPFGSLEYQPIEGVQLIGEYDAVDYNTGIKLYTPKQWLPMDAQLALQYEVYSSNSSDNNLWSLSAAFPLLGTDSNRTTNLTNKLTLEDKVQVALHHHKSASVAELKKALIDEGFLNVSISQQKDSLNIALENRRYNHNQADGLGVALGIITAYAGEDLYRDLGIENPEAGKFTLFQLVNKVPVSSVSGSTHCYREFIQNGEACTDLVFSNSDMGGSYAEAQFPAQDESSSFGRSQLILTPSLYHKVATEYGVSDYSLGLGINLYTSLWKGAAFDVLYLTPIANSDDFEDGGYWEDEAIENDLNRVLLHQTFALPFNLINQTSVGYLFGNYIGAINDTQWVSPQGRHIFGAEVSRFETYDSDAADETRDTLLGSYTLSVPEWNWQLTGKAGQFWKGDTGFRLTTSHWLGDVRVDGSYLRSTAENSDTAEQFLTLSFSIPLTFWRDMNPGYLQVRGIDQFTYSLQTRIDDDHNYLNTGLGGDASLQHNLTRQYLNRQRSGNLYYEENIQRMRNAYLRYVDTVY